MTNHEHEPTGAEPVAVLRVGAFGLGRRYSLYRDRIERGKESWPLTGVQAEVRGGIATDPLLTITGPDFAWHNRADRFHAGRARRFATRVNTMARLYEGRDTTEGETS